MGFHVNHVSVIVKGNYCPKSEEVERMRYKREDADLPSMGITVKCESCDKFFDKHFHKKLEAAQHEKTSVDKELIGSKFENPWSLLNANAGYTQTKIARDEHNVIGHQVYAGLGLPGWRNMINATAGHRHEASVPSRHGIYFGSPTKGFYFGSKVNAGLKGPMTPSMPNSDGTQGPQWGINGNAGAHYGNSFAAGIPVGASVGASVGADATSHLSDDVKIGIGYGVGIGGQLGYSAQDRNVGIQAITPVGSFGAKFGCSNQICYFACVEFTIC